MDLLRENVGGDQAEGGLHRRYGDVTIDCAVAEIGDVAVVLQRGAELRFGFFEWCGHTPAKAAEALLETHLCLQALGP